MAATTRGSERRSARVGGAAVGVAPSPGATGEGAPGKGEAGTEVVGVGDTLTGSVDDGVGADPSEPGAHPPSSTVRLAAAVTTCMRMVAPFPSRLLIRQCRRPAGLLEEVTVQRCSATFSSRGMRWARDDGTVIAAHHDGVRFLDLDTGEVRDGRWWTSSGARC